MTRWTNELRSGVHARPGHDEFYASLRRYAHCDSRDLLFVNAGIDPARPLSEQGDAFWWGGRYFDALNGTYDSFSRVIRGSDSEHRGVLDEPHRLSLDGGAGFEGPATAALLSPQGDLLDLVQI